MYLEMYDDIAHNKIKLQNKHLFNHKPKYDNKNHWQSISQEIMTNMAHEIAYKYCLHKAKTKVNTELA
jgi:hypothetical protein